VFIVFLFKIEIELSQGILTSLPMSKNTLLEVWSEGEHQYINNN
jgi:hypothetical protein